MSFYRGSHQIVIQAGRQKVFSVLEDYESLSSFMPDFLSVRVDQVVNHRVWVSFEQTFFRKSLSYSLQLDHKAPTQIVWTLAHSEQLRAYSGSLSLEEVEQSSTRVTVKAELEMLQWIPDAMFSRVQEAFFPRLLEAYKTQAEAL